MVGMLFNNILYCFSNIYIIIQLLIVYHFVAALFICISTYIHIKNNRDERKVKSTKKST